MGVLCCYFRPKHVQYHSCTLGAPVLATVVGPSPNGPQFATFGAPKEVGGCPQGKSKGCPLAKSKASRQTDWSGCASGC